MISHIPNFGPKIIYDMSTFHISISIFCLIKVYNAYGYKTKITVFKHLPSFVTRSPHRQKLVIFAMATLYLLFDDTRAIGTVMGPMIESHMTT